MPDNEAQAAAPQHGALSGFLERADRQAITGWAADLATPEAPVALELLIDGAVVGTLEAASFRQDLADAGVGCARHGFQIYLPRGLSAADAHEVRVRRAADGQELAGSPRLIPPEAQPEAALRQGIADALDEAATNAGPGEFEALIGELAERAAALLFARGARPDDAQHGFLARWGAAPLPAIEDPRPRALFIDESVPDASRDAGSNAALSHIQALQRLGYRVDFVPAYGMELVDASAAGLRALGVTIWHAPWTASVEEVLRRIGPRLDLAYLHRFGIIQRYGALVRRWCPNARLLYCVADLHYLRMARRMAVEAGGAAETAPVTAEAAGLRTAELLCAYGADAVITHSSFEAALLRREAPDLPVHLVPWEVTPRPTQIPFADRNGVAFVGSYGHAPNLDAAHWLVDVIMPLVWARNPGISCLLAGSDLPASLREAAARAPGGRVATLGHVPSLDTLWNQVRVAAAPLRYGAGLKGKVLDALAAGIPCVCSPMAAEGMDLPASLADLVADTPEAIADAILRLHGDAEENARATQAGLAWVAETLSATRINMGLWGAVK